MTNVISMMRDSLTNLCALHGERQGRVELNQETPIFDDEQLLNAPGSVVAAGDRRHPAFDSVRAWRDWQAGGTDIEAISLALPLLPEPSRGRRRFRTHLRSWPPLSMHHVREDRKHVQRIF
jgi:hypothetical protein